MTDTMRKRLERSVCTAATDGFLDDEPGCYAVGIGMPGRCGACLLMVDAILSVLESPSEFVKCRGSEDGIGGRVTPDGAQAIWRAMIAAIKAGA